MAADESPAIVRLLRQDALRWEVLGHVADMDLPEGCVGAGFVRNLVWDHFHERRSDCRVEDIDVLYFDRSRTGAEEDAELEEALRHRAPDFKWSVRNQARMHLRNGDDPYGSVEDAMRYWPETATAVAARRVGADCILIAPFGTEDLMRMILRPTSDAAHKLAAFDARQHDRKWRQRWPDMRVAAPSDSPCQ
ncbi:nucleotidyltransferase family protein [Pararhodobacter sp. SW119]|uniref:nucleotidyltransferase family protein n=1 Tax=Pararhodobacter sp. SW119 TaxID=2780075 RepID=UPI001ADF98EE|nr:nucleotidyltransferase family protein [Pararhodobacter sp. SW119]